jgi:hypothetical protein
MLLVTVEESNAGEAGRLMARRLQEERAVEEHILIE